MHHRRRHIARLLSTGAQRRQDGDYPVRLRHPIAENRWPRSCEVSRLWNCPVGFIGSWPRRDTGLWIIHETSCREVRCDLLSSYASAAATAATRRPGDHPPHVLCSHWPWLGWITVIQLLSAYRRAQLHRFSVCRMLLSDLFSCLCRSHAAGRIADNTSSYTGTANNVNTACVVRHKAPHRMKSSLSF